MATNPMQRQARNSFLLGVIITLVVALIIGALLVMQIKKLNEQIKADQAATKVVFVVNQDIKSGQVITADMFSKQEVKSTAVPADATSDITTLLSNYSLCDKSGNNIYTDSDGSLYMMGDGNNKVKVYKETTGEYYTQTGSNGEKNYIETTQKALIAKVDMKANTVISSSFIARADEIQTDDVRQEEYNVIVLPTDLMTGDYVDIRLMLPNGTDLIVISKKMVTIPDINGEYLDDTIWVNLSEDEILSMSSAIVEAFKIEGSKLYATKYTDAGSQEAATPTYVANDAVVSLMDSDPNITAEAKAGLRERYTDAMKNIRNNYINGALSTYGNDDGVADKIDESIVSTQESRQEYLQSLSGTATN